MQLAQDRVRTLKKEKKHSGYLRKSLTMVFEILLLGGECYDNV
jgi:hypothetical protein